MSRLEDLIRSDLNDDAARFQPSADLDATIDEAIGRREHRNRLVVLGTTAALTLAVAIGIAALIALPGRDHREHTGVATQPSSTTSPTLAMSTGTTVVDEATTTTTAPPAAAPPAPEATTPPDTQPATVPDTPVVTVTAADDSGQCTASWTVDNGGSPITLYYFYTESIPLPPSTDPVQTTSARIEKTTDTTQQVLSGSLVTVTAENEIGKGSTSDKVACGG